MGGASRSRPIPATIGTIFGGLWALIAAMALPPHWRFSIAVIAGLTTLLLVVRLWRETEPLSGSDERLFGRKSYQIAVVVEVAAIYTASAILPRFGWQSYLLQVVGVIVGLHFIGLWVATRSERFLGIAGGMCVISSMALLFPTTAHPSMYGIFSQELATRSSSGRERDDLRQRKREHLAISFAGQICGART